MSVLCKSKLEKMGVLGDIRLSSYTPDFYIFDSDVMSIEWPLSYKECYLESDYSSLYQAARSLMSLQSIFGIIPTVSGIGRSAKIVYDIMLRMRREMSGIEPSLMPQIDQLVLIDRAVDLLTPMTFQLNYEGILDEIYGINQTVIKLPAGKFEQNSADDAEGSSSAAGGGERRLEPPSGMKRFYLNSSEELFTKLRDAHYISVGSILNSTAKSLVAQYDERKHAKSVREMRQFVEKLPRLQKQRESQSNHTSMAELVREYTDQSEFNEYLLVSQFIALCHRFNLFHFVSVKTNL